MTYASRSLMLLALCASLFGCGDDKGWDHAVILQLFISQDLRVSKIAIEAVQAGNTRSVTIEDPEGFFASCDSNRVRIIPQTDGEQMNPIAITVSGEGFSSIARQIDNPDGTETVIIGGASSDLQPKCSATPTYQPDAAVDAPPPPGKLGASCSANKPCESGLTCLTESDTFWANSDQIKLWGGYCAIEIHDAEACSSIECECTDGLCEEGSVCFANRQPNQDVVGVYCLGYCESEDDCRDGYKCSAAANNCFPEAK